MSQTLCFIIETVLVMHKCILMFCVIYSPSTPSLHLNEVTHEVTGPPSGLVLDIGSFYFMLLLGDQSQAVNSCTSHC